MITGKRHLPIYDQNHTGRKINSRYRNSILWYYHVTGHQYSWLWTSSPHRFYDDGEVVVLQTHPCGLEVSPTMLLKRKMIRKVHKLIEKYFSSFCLKEIDINELLGYGCGEVYGRL